MRALGFMVEDLAKQHIVSRFGTENGKQLKKKEDCF